MSALLGIYRDVAVNPNWPLRVHLPGRPGHRLSHVCMIIRILICHGQRAQSHADRCPPEPMLSLVAFIHVGPPFRLCLRISLPVS